MGQKSSIETNLSDGEIKLLGKKISSGKWSVTGLTELLSEWGYEISRTAVGRYKKNYEDQIKEDALALRESRLIVEALGKELGDSESLGEQGRLLVEMARNLTFDLIRKARTEEKVLEPKDIAMLGKGLAEMGRALRLDQDYENKVRETIIKEERRKAANAAQVAAVEGGATEEQAAFIRAQVMGISDRVETEDG